MNSHPNPSLLRALRDIFSSNQILTDKADCWTYGYDNSRKHHLPDYVAFPQKHEQVVACVQACYQHETPITARGRGSGTTGATVPTRGGLVMSMEQMNNEPVIDTANRYMIAQPGVTNLAVQEAAKKHGFFWPPDPTSAAFCSIGGNLAYNSAGPRAVKYGTPRENVFGLVAVSGKGETLKTGVVTSKGVVGYDLTRLLIGSEGTLAIITEATLRLTPIPESKRTIRAIYNSMVAAAQAVSYIMAQPVTPCALEFIDGNAINAVRKYASTDIPENAEAMLMIEIDGLESSMSSAVQAVSDAASLPGLLELKVATSQQEVSELWKIRKALSPALRNIAPQKINEDVVVPVSRMAELIEGLKHLSQHHRIPIVNFGHAGNGNIHVNLLVNQSDNHEMERAEQCLSDVFSLVLELEGTLSGEHGIGLEKKNFINLEIPETTLNVMKNIKQVFDPKGILNPGKMFPDQS